MPQLTDECCHKTRMVGAPCPIGRHCPHYDGPTSGREPMEAATMLAWAKADEAVVAGRVPKSGYRTSDNMRFYQAGIVEGCRRMGMPEEKSLSIEWLRKAARGAIEAIQNDNGSYAIDLLMDALGDENGE